MKALASDVDSQSLRPSQPTHSSVLKLERSKVKSKTEKSSQPYSQSIIPNEQSYSNGILNEELNKDIDINNQATYSTPKHNETNVTPIVRSTHQNKTFSPPIWFYFNNCEQYLQNLIKQKEGTIRSSAENYENSHNFIEKDSYISKSKENYSVNQDNEVIMNENNDSNANNIDIGVGVGMGIKNEMEQFEHLSNTLSNNHSPFFPHHPMIQQHNLNSIGRCNSYTYHQPPNPYLNINTSPYQFQQHHPQIQMQPLPMFPPMHSLTMMSPLQPQQQPENKLNYHLTNSNINNNNNNNNEHIDQYTTEMFGRKGWICTLCNNFNYDIRSKCNRCKNDKSPKVIRSVIPNTLFNPLIDQSNFNISPIPMQFDQDNNSSINSNNNNNININISNITYNNIINGNNSNNMITSNGNIDDNESNMQGDDVNANNEHLLYHNTPETLNHSTNSIPLPVSAPIPLMPIPIPLLNRNNTLFVNDNPQQHENESKIIMNNSLNTTNTNNSNINNVYQHQKKLKPFSEQIGDWVCNNCKNLNFSFRTFCNRCQISKSDSSKLIFN